MKNYKPDWWKKPFPECITPVRFERSKQIKTNSYLPIGNFPIIDQGQTKIAGWTNDKSAVINDNLPLIIFGDHTRVFKYIDFPFAIGADGTKIIKPNRDEFCSRYIYYYLQNLNLPSRGYSRHYKLLKESEISYPEISEQEKIAAVLLIIQHAIEVQESIIEAVQELKKSTMEHVFTYGLRGEKTKETEIGRVPESWGIVSLEDLCAIERGKFTHRPRNDPAYYGGNIPFVQTGDIANSNGRVTNYSQTLNELGLSVSKIFPKGTILITIAANIGDTGILEFDSAFPDSIIGLTVTEEINGYYLEYYLRTQKRKMMQLAPKGTQLNINIQFLRPWPVLCPGIEEQIEIAETFQSIDNKIELHTTKKDVLQDLFKTMLNKLMTGQIRVKDLDIDTSWVMEMKNKG